MNPALCNAFFRGGMPTKGLGFNEKTPFMPAIVTPSTVCPVQCSDTRHAKGCGGSFGLRDIVPQSGHGPSMWNSPDITRRAPDVMWE